MRPLCVLVAHLIVRNKCSIISIIDYDSKFSNYDKSFLHLNRR